jgi:hypothetical protein
MTVFARLLNWKKHPASVFYFAVPLALIGFALLGLRAVIEIVSHGDWAYAGICLAGLALLALGLWPLRHLIAKALADE